MERGARRTTSPHAIEAQTNKISIVLYSIFISHIYSNVFAGHASNQETQLYKCMPL